eukprot:CAMPEP_0117780060 /NCGR_PEP_ID=MMETSP0948-20121206/1997_1 /TAXON_ID=44440 /ORGANISM="Chattonella subsalsa, Strain CCMP2191" /LENGTH=326 /DNA_ID=CAMNT_0005607771 /DNA_START=81 /DNA_END=1063 /DNA_ORIENTATION=-
MSNIGMMDQAYFVVEGRINEFLGTNLQKIEQTASGAIACQLLDSLHPGVLPMSKVNWDAKNDYEFVDNYKLLQRSFDKIGIDKHVDVQKLIRARYQDNLEFMQWFKRYFELNQPVEGYDPIERRKEAKVGLDIVLRALAVAAVVGQPQRGRQPVLGQQVPPVAVAEGVGWVQLEEEVGDPADRAAPLASPGRKSGGSAGNLKINQLEEEKEELNGIIDSLTEEREFYFEKLREIEILLQSQVDDGKDSPLIQAIFKILYATNDDSGEAGAQDEGGEPVDGEAPPLEEEGEEGLPPEPPHEEQDYAVEETRKELDEQGFEENHEETY